MIDAFQDELRAARLRMYEDEAEHLRRGTEFMTANHKSVFSLVRANA